MKVGDTEAVAIRNDVVAQAKVVEIDRDNNTVTLIVPATRVVMGLKLEIDTTPPAPSEEGTGHVLIGTEGAVTTHVESAAPVEGTVSVENPAVGVIDGASIRPSTEDTPTGEATQSAVEGPEKAVEASE